MAFAGTVFVRPAFARQDVVPGSRYTSARGAAMGDAFLPLADDGASALFYNPAAIGQVKKTHFELLNLQLEANSDYVGMFDRNFFKVTNLPGYTPNLAQHPGEFPGVGMALFPNVYGRGWAVGVLAQDRVAATWENGTVTYRSRYELIPTVGGAVRLARGIVRLGYALQWVHLATGTVSVPDTAIGGYNEGLARGAGLSHNFGFSLTLPIRLLPAFNLVIRNIGGTSYSGTPILLPPGGSGSGTPPPREDMSFDASFSIQPKVGKGGYMNVVLEARDLTNRSNTPWSVRAALGLEFSFRNVFFLRGGFGSGYPTAGIGFGRETAQFGFTWHSEELGPGFHSNREQRWLMQYQIRAF